MKERRREERKKIILSGHSFSRKTGGGECFAKEELQNKSKVNNRLLDAATILQLLRDSLSHIRDTAPGIVVHVVSHRGVRDWD